ncbi:hypothetical protein Tco_0374114 [Tanacetum coccineum]
MNAKVDEPRISDIPVARDITDVFPEDIFGAYKVKVGRRGLMEVGSRVDSKGGQRKEDRGEGAKDWGFGRGEREEEYCNAERVLSIKDNFSVPVLSSSMSGMSKEEHESSFEVSVGVTEEGEAVTTRRNITFFKIVEPLTSLTERNQKFTSSAMSIKRREKSRRERNDTEQPKLKRPIKENVLLVGRVNGIAHSIKHQDIKNRLRSLKWMGALKLYRLRLHGELNSMHDIFHVSNPKKCLANASVHVPLDEIKVDKILRFVEEPVEIMDQEIRKLKHRKIVLVVVRRNSKHSPEFT